MSLNHISLPAPLVAGLYQHTLIQDAARPVPQRAATPFLGENKKHILIVVQQPALPFLPDSELTFLTKVLTACQLSLLDVAIVNWSSLPRPEGADLLAQFGAKAVILFNLDAAAFGLPQNSPLYTLQHKNEIPFVLAPSLGEIEKTKESKQQLWLLLKQLFGL